MEWYRRLWPVWLFLVYFLVALAVHHSGFNAPFYYDSAARLGQNWNAFDRGLTETVNIFPQRPVPMTTFYLNYLFGGMNPRPFRICNAAGLAATAVTLVLLIGILLEISRAHAGLDRETVHRTAAALGLLFLVHPIHTYVVVYVWQRMALLACLFSLASLAAYLVARSGRMARPALGYASSALLFLLALASKENAVVVPLLVLTAEIAFFPHTWRTFAARAATCLAVGLACAGMLSFLESPHGLGESSGITATLARYYAESRLTLVEAVLTQCRVLFSYLEMILIPFTSNVRLFSPQIVSTSLFDPAGTLPAVAGTAALLTTGLYLLWRRPLSGFGLIFFLASLLPESLLVPQYQFFGYRVILPMAGLFLVAADVIALGVTRIRASPRRVALSAGIATTYAAMVLLAAWVTTTKAELWNHPAAFWREVVDTLPPNPHDGERAVTHQALTSLGMSLLQQGKPHEAFQQFSRLLSLDPKSFPALVSLGNAHAALGNLDEAESSFHKALEIDPKSSDAHVALGRLFMAQGRLQEALDRFAQARALDPQNPLALYEMGRAYIAVGRHTAAIPLLRQAAELNRTDHETHYALGKALMRSGDYRSAMDSFRRTLEIRPDHWRSHNDMGVIWGTLGRPDKAVPHFRQALEINPDDVPTKRNLDAALRQVNQPAGNRP
ncbi:MAG: tetratricopeptide repeat protein [Desulfomonilaceae bacterium]|nr:tetratricopeptide repeat protein [Desulfomonilaceae bacterium]